ncbi:signal peptidase II [Ascidiaceihabitans sp.]|uniref:signal peptidase II n=1 Tax=Ascidiaceihabitans sp. TaxID=1872644 RepID=UPI003299FD5A
MRLMFLFSMIAFLADQASKYWVVHVMEIWKRPDMLPVIPPVLNFSYGENRGINFGLFASDNDMMRWVLIGLAVAICVAVVFWMRKREQPLIVHASAGFLIGGALGNVVDRVWYGYVLDFLNTSCCGWVNPTVYNVADVFIVLGALGMIFFANEGKDDPKKGRKKGA